MHYCILVEEVMFSKMHSYKTSSAKISLSQVSLNRQCSRLQHKVRQICEGEARFLLTPPPVPHESRSRSSSAAPACTCTERDSTRCSPAGRTRAAAALESADDALGSVVGGCVSSVAVGAAVCPDVRQTQAQSGREPPRE